MKTMTTAADNASQAEAVDMALLLELRFDSATKRYNLSGGSIAWNSQVWTGAGHISEITEITESQEFEIVGFNVGMNAGSFASNALGEKVRGRPAYVYILFFDEDGAVIEDPALIGAGRMDKMPIKLGRSGRIDLSVLNRVADWQRVNASRWTDAEQKSRYPDDRGFEQVSQVVERQVPWGPTE